MSKNNIRQAQIPEGARIIDNNNGLAPGVFIRLSAEEAKKFGKNADNAPMILLLPGPPEELTAMWEGEVAAMLQKDTGQVIYSAMVKIVGRAESEVAELLDDLISAGGEIKV